MFDTPDASPTFESTVPPGRRAARVDTDRSRAQAVEWPRSRSFPRCLPSGPKIAAITLSRSFFGSPENEALPSMLNWTVELASQRHRHRAEALHHVLNRRQPATMQKARAIVQEELGVVFLVSCSECEINGPVRAGRACCPDHFGARRRHDQRRQRYSGGGQKGPR